MGDRARERARGVEGDLSLAAGGSHPALYVLFVHAGIASLLIVTGTLLDALGSIGQDTLLAMISGAVGLLSGGGTAIALQQSLKPTSRQLPPPPPPSP